MGSTVYSSIEGNRQLTITNSARSGIFSYCECLPPLPSSSHHRAPSLFDSALLEAKNKTRGGGSSKLVFFFAQPQTDHSIHFRINVMCVLTVYFTHILFIKKLQRLK